MGFINNVKMAFVFNKKDECVNGSSRFCCVSNISSEFRFEIAFIFVAL